MVTSHFLRIAPPEASVMQKVEIPVIQPDQALKVVDTLSDWKEIYTNDLFGTYSAPKVPDPVQQNLVTPIPEMKEAAIVPVPELKAQELVPPLNLTIHGIIIGAQDHKNVAMIEDETKKEKMYYLGDKYKDAVILKIARNRIVFLRSNGQQEIFYLRKADMVDDPNSPDRWQYIIKKIEDNLYEVDPNHFAEEIPSLGIFLDRSGIVGTAYKDGKTVGISIGEIEQGDLGEHLGFRQSDILLRINGINLADKDERLKAYDAVIKSTIGSSITLGLLRNNVEVEYVYKLKKITKTKKIVFSDSIENKQPSQPQQQVSPAEGLKMNAAQEREQQMRDFAAQHPNNQQQEAIMQLRKRLLENLRARLQNVPAS